MSAVIRGTRSTLEEYAQPAFTSGLRSSAYCAADGRRIRCGMVSDSLPLTLLWVYLRKRERRSM